jgi:hypothetical protein
MTELGKEFVEKRFLCDMSFSVYLTRSVELGGSYR